jgi:hypothetical protein
MSVSWTSEPQNVGPFGYGRRVLNEAYSYSWNYNKTFTIPAIASEADFATHPVGSGTRFFVGDRCRKLVEDNVQSWQSASGLGGGVNDPPVGVNDPDPFGIVTLDSFSGTLFTEENEPKSLWVEGSYFRYFLRTKAEIYLTNNNCASYSAQLLFYFSITTQHFWRYRWTETDFFGRDFDYIFRHGGNHISAGATIVSRNDFTAPSDANVTRLRSTIMFAGQEIVSETVGPVNPFTAAEITFTPAAP